MIINIAYPARGTQKAFEYKDEKMWQKLYESKLGQEVSGNLFGENFENYVFRVTGGSDTNGFGMKQGVLTKNKLKLLLAPGTSGYFCKRTGVHKRKAVRGCIIGREISSLNLVVVRKGDKEIEGLTDVRLPLRLGPKRANKIRKLFNLPRHSDNIGKKDADKVKVSNVDVCRAVVRRVTKEVGDKKYYKAPKITRLLTTERLRRKKQKRSIKLQRCVRNQESMKVYAKMVNQRKTEEKIRKKSSRK